MRPPPRPSAPVTHGIALLCAGLALVALLPGMQATLVLGGGMIPAVVAGTQPAAAGALPGWATLVTHQFLHGGLVHLVMNMVFLVWIGRQLEAVLGSGRLLILYLVSGIAGGLLQILGATAPAAPVVGASGAISGLFAAYVLLFARSAEAPGRLFGLALSGGTVRALRYAALWIGLQLLVAVALNVPGSSGGIAIWAHIGGFLAGLVMAFPLVAGSPRRPG